MFEITAAGAIMAAAGIAYLLVAGHWLLPNREALANLLPRSEDRHFMADVLVPLGSPMVGKRLQAAGFTDATALLVTIGRAHVCTPVNISHFALLYYLEK